jgi:hypothetical protein
MTIISSLDFAALAVILANPLVLLHLGLAAAHTVPACYYLRHEGGWPLVVCYALISTFYLLLAVLHGLAH